MMKSRKMRWPGHGENMGRRGMHVGFGGKSQKEKEHKESLDVDSINVKVDLREIGRGYIVNSYGSRWVP
jgi:hypothetical protein